MKRASKRKASRADGQELSIKIQSFGPTLEQMQALARSVTRHRAVQSYPARTRFRLLRIDFSILPQRVPIGKAISNLRWSPVRLHYMRRARPPSASNSGRSTKLPAIACASSSLMKRPARRLAPNTKPAATRWRRASISSSPMRSSTLSRLRAPIRSRSTASCRARRSISASSIPPYYITPNEPEPD
jgi:hypothetical protein